MCGRKKGTLEISIWELGQGLAVGGALLPGLVEALMSELTLPAEGTWCVWPQGLAAGKGLVLS